MPHYHFERHRRALGTFGGLVLLIAVLGLILGGITTQHALRRAMQGRDGRLAARSVAAMTVPADYVRFTTGCHFYRCYTVRRPVASVASDARNVLLSAGAVSEPSARFPDAACDRPLPPGWDTERDRCDDAGYVHHRVVLVLVRIHYAVSGSGAEQPTHTSEVDVSFSPALAV